MNPITRAMASLARGFLAYVESPNKLDEPEITPITYSAREATAIQPTAVEVWDNLNLQDMPGEKWQKLDVETRDVMISNLGRVKLFRTRKSGGEYIIVKPHVSKGAVFFQVAQKQPRNTVGRKLYTFSAPRAVLLAFVGEPEWAEKYPDALRRSLRSIVHKNQNPHDCNVDNLCWVSEEHADIIQRSFDYHNNKVAQESVEPQEPAPPSPPVKEWHDVPHFVGFYQVSAAGDVRSLDRYIHRYGAKRVTDENTPKYLTADKINENLKKSYRFVRGVNLKPIRQGGELTVVLCREGLSVPVPVARLLIETFHPHIKASYNYEYIDGDLNNCSIANLRLV